MFGPSGDRTGSIREYWLALMSRIEKLARSRVTPPDPMTDKRRRLSISDKGLAWSKMVDKRFLRKNSEMVAIKGRAFTKELGVKSSSVLVSDIFSRIALSIRRSPIRKELVILSSPTRRTRRFER